MKKYDAAVIALPNDADEIPMEADKRLELVAKIVRVATQEYGIALEDIVIDPLAMPIGADTSTVVQTTIETMRRIRDEFGLNMTCGASNVSFGMPGRHTLERGVPADGDDRGLTSAIMDARTPQIVDVGQGGRPAARPRRVGHGLDRARTAPSRPRQHDAGPSHVYRRTRRADVADLDSLRREGLIEPPAGEPPSRRRTTAPAGSALTAAAGRAHRPRAARRHRLRRRQLERHRDRLDLRRPRHLQEVQGAASSTAPSRCRGSTRAPSRADQLRDGWRLACLAQATHDLTVEVPPLMTRPKAATVGVGRQVILRPAVQKRYVELTEPTLADQRTDLVRLLDAIDDLELHRRPARPAPAAEACCARPTSRSPRWSSTRR